MRASSFGLLCAVAAAAVLGLGSTGCTDLGVGRKCLASGTVKGTQISSPALECLSKLCFLEGDPTTGDVTRSVCTARCTTDADCKGALIGTDTGECSSAFVCGVATVLDAAGSGEDLACQGICICQDDLVKGSNADNTTGLSCCPTACSTANNCPPNLPVCT